MWPLSPLVLASALLLALPSHGLTIPTALLCLDPNLEQHLLAGVDMPQAIESIVSELGVARQSACSSAKGPAASSTGGAEQSIDPASPTSTSEVTTTPLPTPPGDSSRGNSTAVSEPSSLLASSTTSAPLISAVPSLATSTLAPTEPSSKLLPILLGVLIPLVFLILLALAIFLCRRRRRRRDQEEGSQSTYPYMTNPAAPANSVTSVQPQPFWRTVGRRPRFVQMPTSSTTATVPWDPLPPRPGGSRSTLPLTSDNSHADMSEQRVLYLVGTRTPGALTGTSQYTDERGFPWGQSEVELGGGRTPTGRGVEIVRTPREGSIRTGTDSMSLDGRSMDSERGPSR